MWEEYNLEKFKANSGTTKRRVIDTTVFKKPVFKSTITIDLPKVSELNNQHPARTYLTERGISQEKLSKFYFAEKFKEWTNTLKQTYESIDSEESRIVIPLLDEEGNLFGYQGRSLKPKDKLRYVTVMLSDDVPKVYGLNEIEKSSPVYVTEGPIDATFLRNAIAMCGSDVDLRSFDYQFVFVFDNEPRNKQIVEKIAKSALNGDRVVIWPSTIKEKDINDMVLAGHNVETVIKSHTYQGLEAQVKLSEWKRV